MWPSKKVHVYRDSWTNICNCPILCTLIIDLPVSRTPLEVSTWDHDSYCRSCQMSCTTTNLSEVIRKSKWTVSLGGLSDRTLSVPNSRWWTIFGREKSRVLLRLRVSTRGGRGSHKCLSHFRFSTRELWFLVYITVGTLCPRKSTTTEYR